MRHSVKATLHKTAQRNQIDTEPFFNSMKATSNAAFIQKSEAPFFIKNPQNAFFNNTNTDTIQPKVNTTPISNASNQSIIQRMITLYIDNDNIVTTKQTSERPPGGLPGGSQGDHTTPFSVLQDQIANSVELSDIHDAWSSLYNTYKIFQELPGWETTKKTERNAYVKILDEAFKNRGGIDQLQYAVMQMLYLRNVIDLTSVEKGGHGNGEPKWVGGLADKERQLQLHHGLDLTKKMVITYMWKAFEHGRLNQMKSKDRIDKVLRQHAITIVDAYPLLSQHLNISSDDVLQAYATRNDWATYQPEF